MYNDAIDNLGWTAQSGGFVGFDPKDTDYTTCRDEAVGLT